MFDGNRLNYRTLCQLYLRIANLGVPQWVQKHNAKINTSNV